MRASLNPPAPVRRLDFASDNVAGAAPEVLDALARHNCGTSANYGRDSFTRAAADLVRGLLDMDGEVFFVTSGTAANALALSALCRSFECVLLHEHAHAALEEAGAPAFFGHGLALSGLAGRSARIDEEGLDRTLEFSESAQSQLPAALSLSNATEYGTVYQSDEMRRLVERAQAKDLHIHLDGARLANAAAAGLDLKDLGKLGLDIVVVGGTKAGMIGSEAVVVKPVHARRFEARLKQAGQVSSKSRFHGLQWLGMLEAGTWHSRAAHANRMASSLASAMPLPVAHPVETNAVFVRMDLDYHSRLDALGWSAVRFADGTVRFMCSWATTEEEIGDLVRDLETIHKG